MVAAFVFGGGDLFLVFELEEASLCSRETFVCGWCAFFCFCFCFCFFFLARGLESKRQGRTEGGKEGVKRQQREREEYWYGVGNGRS